MSAKMCVRCGSVNDAQNVVCAKCGVRLPNPDLTSPELHLQVDTLAQRIAEIRIACDKVRDESLTIEAFADFLKLWGASLRRQKSQSLMIVDESSEDQIHDVESDEVDPNFEHFSRGLDIIWPFLEDGDFERLDRGLQIMEEGNELLLGLKPADVGLIEHAQEEVSCILCGAKNSAYQTVCNQCGAKLPKIVNTDPERTEHRQVTARYDQFKAACDKVTNGTWSHQEFAGFLEGIQETLRARRVSYEQAVGDYEEFASDEVATAKSGMDDYEHGMEEMWVFVSDPDNKDLEALKRGLELIWSGNEKINKAMVMNRAYRSELADEFGYV